MENNNASEEKKNLVIDPNDNPLQKETKTKFQVGELLPIKGAWFRVDKIDNKQMSLVPVGWTSKTLKRIVKAQREELKKLKKQKKGTRREESQGSIPTQ